MSCPIKRHVMTKAASHRTELLLQCFAFLYVCMYDSMRMGYVGYGYPMYSSTYYGDYSALSSASRARPPLRAPMCQQRY